MIALIPAYEPNDELISLVKRLREETPYAIVVVDDGSSPGKAHIFEALEGLATVLHHNENRGKGAALKTGLAYVQAQFPQAQGVVTVDADGQHLVSDIIRVCQDFLDHPDSLTLGSRMFTGDVPFKSRAGNAITREVFALSTGVRLLDTQTGLRAFAVSAIPAMLSLKGERYEYEINMLLYATRHRIPIREVVIETVYIDDNQTTHFHPLRDAWRIYKMILLFVASSLMAFAVDYAMVLLLSAMTRSLDHSLLISVVGARVISSLCNYFVNYKIVFGAGDRSSIFKYYLLAAVILACNYALMALTTKTLGMALPLAKILVEAALYPLSFIMQRRFVFAEKE